MYKLVALSPSVWFSSTLPTTTFYIFILIIFRAEKAISWHHSDFSVMAFN